MARRPSSTRPPARAECHRRGTRPRRDCQAARPVPGTSASTRDRPAAARPGGAPRRHRPKRSRPGRATRRREKLHVGLQPAVDLRGDRCAVRRFGRFPEQLVDALFGLVAHDVLPAAGLIVHDGEVEADHVRQQRLGDAVLAQHPNRFFPTRRGQHESSVWGYLNEAIALHARNRLRHRRPRVSESLGNSGTQRSDVLFFEVKNRSEVHLRCVHQVRHHAPPSAVRQARYPNISAPPECNAQAHAGRILIVMTDIRIPVDLLPADGRFGSGPRGSAKRSSTNSWPAVVTCSAPRTARRR